MRPEWYGKVTNVVATQERETARGRRSRSRWLGWVLTIILVAAPWIWFGIRDVGPAIDAVAVGLPLGTTVLAVLTLGAAMRPGRLRLVLVSLSLAAFTVAVVVEPRLPQPSPAPVDPFRLVAANTFEDNLEPQAAAQALVASRPDVLVTVETSAGVLSMLRSELGRFRHALHGELSVFAQWHLTPPTPIPSVPPSAAVRVRVDRPGDPFVVYAVHLPNPIHEVSFSQQRVLVDALLRAARAEPLPVVLAGDFNMTDRSSSYRELDGRLYDAMRSSLAGSTYRRALWVLLQLRIDHVFVSAQVCSTDARTIDVPGSDHRGLDVLLGRCP